MSKNRDYLRKRPQYGEMINEIVQQPKIKFPDRRATFLRNTHYMSQFDGDQSFINLEEQESNMAKQQVLEQELRRVSRTAKATHTGLLAEASIQKAEEATQQVLALLPSGYNTGEDVDEVQSIQSSRELQERAKRFNVSEAANLHLQTLARRGISSVEEFQSPRENPKDFTSDPAAIKIFEGVRTRLRQKAPEVASAVGSGALALAGAVGSGALSVASAVGRWGIKRRQKSCG